MEKGTTINLTMVRPVQVYPVQVYPVQEYPVQEFPVPQSQSHSEIGKELELILITIKLQKI